jgi:hypothetical protein
MAKQKRKTNKDAAWYKRRVSGVGTGKGKERGAVLTSIDAYDYSEDEVEFLRAVDRYRTKTGHLVLAVHEYLAVAKSLGYRKDG